MNIGIMPDEILVKIFSYLNLYESSKIHRVCRHWSEVGKDNMLWAQYGARPEYAIPPGYFYTRFKYIFVLRKLTAKVDNDSSDWYIHCSGNYPYERGALVASFFEEAEGDSEALVKVKKALKSDKYFASGCMDDVTYTSKPSFPFLRFYSCPYIPYDQVDWSIKFIQNLDNNIKANKKFMMSAIACSGLAIKYASEALRAEKEVVRKAVGQNGLVLEYASAELRANRVVVLIAVRLHGYALKYASNELKSDREVVLAAVKKYGRALQYASNELTADREVVMAAVRQNGAAIPYASAKFRADREVMLAAVKSDARAGYRGDALSYASNELKADSEVVLAAGSEGCPVDFSQKQTPAGKALDWLYISYYKMICYVERKSALLPCLMLLSIALLPFILSWVLNTQVSAVCCLLIAVPSGLIASAESYKWAIESFVLAATIALSASSVMPGVLIAPALYLQISCVSNALAYLDPMRFVFKRKYDSAPIPSILDRITGHVQKSCFAR